MKASTIDTPAETTVDNRVWETDHTRWENDVSYWRQDLRRAIEHLKTLTEIVYRHEEKLDCHGAEVVKHVQHAESLQQACDRHAHEQAGYRVPESSVETLAALGKEHHAQESEHKVIEREHRVLMAHLAMMKSVIEAAD